ncbi:MAG: bifunctional response regulator/alkaline phosphatase family protein, partial [Bacteroidota bacterium]|nr:bifunctional response regulator/alkaline phosphatase family protein [Bacteroidota bacterium]
MANIRILWTDDEIDLLKPHIIFLEHKGYEVHTTTNGQDAVEKVKDEYFDIIFLDENMPGLSGLEALMQIKSLKPNIPVVMITKSEEEDIMDEAIGSKMADYLIKPVNPKQILLSIKKNVEQKRLISQQTTSAYQSEFGRIGMQINDSFTHEEWKEVYRKLIYWELELTASDNSALDEILKMQKSEANQAFGRFIQRNYSDWFGKKSNEKPLFSPDIFRKKVFPLLDQGKKVVVILIDNLRFDQWRIISPFFDEYFVTCEEDLFFSILPTATMYARNAIFAGLMPSEIERLFPSYWINDDEEGNKNQFEQELFETQLQRLGRKEKFYFEKN